MNNDLPMVPPNLPGWSLIPVLAPAGVTRLPLYLVLAYLVATFLSFLLWPINWPIYYASDWARLIAYVCGCFAVIGGGMIAGSGGRTRLTGPLPWLAPVIIAGSAASVILLAPSTYSYTGQAPWMVMDALRDQGAAYHRYQMQLYATGGDRALIAGVRTLASPLVFAVLPLGILHWRRIGWYGRVAVVLAVLASADFSILRGTDKEFADLFMVGGASAFVAYGRDTTLGVRSLDLVRRYWLLAIVGVLFVYVAQGLSIDRKGERNGGFANQTSLCANDSSVCVDLDNPWIAWLPLPQRFGTTSFVLSVSSGYYGLELALEKPFQSSFGLGHSPAALSVYEALSGDQGPHLRTYTYRNGADGWPEDYYWSTLMAWIANDVGFAGTLPLLAGIAYLWGMWWREAAAGMSDPAAILFCLATMMMFYLPANNEVLASYEGYAVLGVWIAIWLVHRRRSAISAIATG